VTGAAVPISSHRVPTSSAGRQRLFTGRGTARRYPPDPHSSVRQGHHRRPQRRKAGQTGHSNTPPIPPTCDKTTQAFRNVLAVLAEAGADQRHIARLNIYLQAGGDATAGYQAAAEVWGQHPTAITVLQVSAFARPDVLVDIDALAVVP